MAHGDHQPILTEHYPLTPILDFIATRLNQHKGLGIHIREPLQIIQLADSSKPDLNVGTKATQS